MTARRPFAVVRWMVVQTPPPGCYAFRSKVLLAVSRRPLLLNACYYNRISAVAGVEWPFVWKITWPNIRFWAGHPSSPTCFYASWIGSSLSRLKCDTGDRPIAQSSFTSLCWIHCAAVSSYMGACESVLAAVDVAGIGFVVSMEHVGAIRAFSNHAVLPILS